MLIKKLRDRFKNFRPAEERHGDDRFIVLTGAENMNMRDVMRLMKFTKLGKDRTRLQVRLSMLRSVCFGIFSINDDKQIGFARAITDHATCYYVTDVVVDPEYRGMGAAEQLMRAMTGSEQLKDLRGVLLTKDAMPLYNKVGFTEYQGTFMDRQPSAVPAADLELAPAAIQGADSEIF